MILPTHQQQCFFFLKENVFSWNLVSTRKEDFERKKIRHLDMCYLILLIIFIFSSFALNNRNGLLGGLLFYNLEQLSYNVIGYVACWIKDGREMSRPASSISQYGGSISLRTCLTIQLATMNYCLYLPYVLIDVKLFQNKKLLHCRLSSFFTKLLSSLSF